MPLQIITFTLNGIDDAAYQAHADQSAPMFAGIPGLRAKTWVANEHTNTYGGVYTWDDSAAMRAYRSGEVFQGLLADPNMIDIAVSEFSVLAGPTRVTRGGTDR